MPPRRRALLDLLEGVALETAALPEPALAAILPVLQQAQRELDRDLRAWVARGKGSDRYTPQAYRSSLLGIESALATIRTRLGPTLFGALVNHSEIARRLARSHTAKEFLAFGSDASLMPTIPVRLAATLATGRDSPLERYSRLAGRYADEALRDIHRELAVGVVRGETNDQLMARLMATGKVAERSGLIADGWLSRSEYRAERVVRTELASAYNTELDDLYTDLVRDFPDLLRRWDAFADGRLCERCQELHGRTINPSKGETFPGSISGPPLHPNCRCRADLWRAEWSRLIA